MISRRILAAFAFLCLIAPAQAQFSKAQLGTQITNDFPDNSVGAITPAIVRTFQQNLVNSYVDWLTCTGTGGIVYWSAGTPTCLTAGTNGQALVLASGIPSWVNIATNNLTAGAGITISGTTNATISITNSITGGSAGGANAIPQITYNAQGEITAATTTAPTPTYSNVTSVPANSILGNNTGSPANAIGLTAGQAGAMLCVPVRNTFTTGTSQTYTTPTCNGVTATWLELDIQGGGAGGGSSGSASVNTGTGGNATTFGALTASGGTGGPGGTNVATAVAAGGACSGSLGTQQNFPGSPGGGASNTSANNLPGGAGGVSFYGGNGGSTAGQGGSTAPANSGGGGGGGGNSTTASTVAGYGGGAGCHIKTIITSPAATYTYTVGAAANGGTAGTSGFSGGNGAAGLIDVVAHWQ